MRPLAVGMFSFCLHTGINKYIGPRIELADTYAGRIGAAIL